MKSDKKNQKRYWYGPYEGYEIRIQRRLQKDMGINEEGAETILRLRSQILELQSQLRQLETELATENANQQIRLAQYREEYYEAIWIELEFQE